MHPGSVIVQIVPYVVTYGVRLPSTALRDAARLREDRSEEILRAADECIRPNGGAHWSQILRVPDQITRQRSVPLPFPEAILLWCARQTVSPDLWHVLT